MKKFTLLLLIPLLFYACSDKQQSQSTPASDNSVSGKTPPTADNTSIPAPATQATETSAQSSDNSANNGNDGSESSSGAVIQNNAENGATTKQSAELDLARKSGCLACHAIDKKVVGPAWMDVSKRYQGGSEIRARLISKVKTGGRGNWTEVVGNVAMPPYSPRVSDENIGKLVDFVLGLAKQ